MTDGPDSNVLDSVASSISDGGLIEWEQVAQQVVGDDDAVLEELRLLEKIAKFHQDTQENPSNQTTAVSDEERRSSDPRTWAHFLILGRLGGGPFGDVYRAHDTKLQCDIALKLMRQDRDSSASVSRVIKETRLLARVRHANLVTVYGADQANGRIGVWMQLVRGTTLAETLTQRGPFDAHEASRIGLDVCRALAVLHRAGLVHGAITARTVMREESGRTVLMDSGARILSGASRTKSDDIHAVAVLLFHLVTKRYPDEVQTPLHTLRPDLPDDFVSIVGRALDADPQRRFQTAAAFEVSLAGMLGETPENASGDRDRTLSGVLNSMVARLRPGR